MPNPAGRWDFRFMAFYRIVLRRFDNGKLIIEIYLEFRICFLKILTEKHERTSKYSRCLKNNWSLRLCVSAALRLNLWASLR